MSAKFKKDSAVYARAVFGTEDHSASRGMHVVLNGGKSQLNLSATVVAHGIILDGEKAGGRDSIGILGGNIGPVLFKLGGNVTEGARLQQKNDGTWVTDDGATSRVIGGIAMETGTTDELIEGVAILPLKVPAAVATADATDLATTEALANALKVAFNALTAAE